MTPFGMRTMRSTAALAHMLPNVSLRIRSSPIGDGGRTLLHVASPTADERDRDSRERDSRDRDRDSRESDSPWVGGHDADEAMVLTPCAFRSAVAGMHEATSRGRRVAFNGLDHGEDPAVDIGTTANAWVHPGGIVCTRIDDRVIAGFVTLLSASECREALATRTVAVPTCTAGTAPSGAARVNLAEDDRLGVTLLWVETGIGGAERDVAVKLLCEVLARCAAEEAEALLPALR